VFTFLIKEKSKARLNDAVGQARPAGQNNIKEPQTRPNGFIRAGRELQATSLRHKKK
jgi:hypothetical protein